MSRVLTISILALLCLLAGCDDRENLIKGADGLKVVPVVYLGDALHIEYLGTTLISNSEKDVDISSWHMDDYIKAGAVKALNSNPKFKVVDGDDAAALEYIKHIEPSRLSPLGGYENAPSLIELGKKSGADLVLVIEYTFNFEHPEYHAYTIRQGNLLGLQGGGFALFRADAFLISVSTGKIVTTTGLGGMVPRKSSRFIDESSATLAPEEEDQTRKEFKRMVDENMPLMVQHLTTMPKAYAPRN